LPFGPELRADDKKKANSADNSSREKQFSQGSKHASNSESSNAEPRVEVNYPEKKKPLNQRKGGPVVTQHTTACVVCKSLT
jgi:hypothetical protein